MISKTTGPITKIQTPFDSPVRELSKHGVKFDLDVTDDATGQASQNVRLFGLGDIGEHNFDADSRLTEGGGGVIRAPSRLFCNIF